MPSLRQRFQNPANARALDNPTAEARCVGPLCGDHVLVSIRMEGGTIREAAFEAQGCPLLVVASDLLCEAVEGARSNEAPRVAAARLREALAHLGPDARTCATLPLVALEDALALARRVPGRNTAASMPRVASATAT